MLILCDCSWIVLGSITHVEYTYLLILQERRPRSIRSQMGSFNYFDPDINDYVESNQKQ